uniref:Glycoside hydrolase family 28 family protein n=1 Tax=Rhizophora mucronata TaxID=61149 RepID=A0A2P2PNU0_RHIMU
MNQFDVCSPVQNMAMGLPEGLTHLHQSTAIE